jgi:hypothetical protein
MPMPPIFELPYFPRPDLLEATLKIFLTGLKQGVTLFAPRRQGKTQFVKRELVVAAAESGWQVVYLDLWVRRSHPDVGLVEGLEQAVQRARGTRFAVTKVTAKAKTPAVDIGGEAERVAPTEPEGVIENRLAAALDALMALTDQITLLVLDEFQALASAQSTDFVAAFRTALQKHQGRLMVFYTGSSREALNQMFRRQRAPLFESAHPLTLPDLGRDFVEDRAVFLEDRTGLTVDVDALARAFERLGHSPEYLNAIIIHLMIGKHTDVDQAMHAWVESQREAGFGARLAELSAYDRAVLHMLAQPDRPKAFSKEAVALVKGYLGNDGPVNTGRIQTSIRKLSRQELVAPTGETGDYEIDDRGLLIWIREADG